jgi:hypothetical protein
MLSWDSRALKGESGGNVSACRRSRDALPRVRRCMALQGSTEHFALSGHALTHFRAAALRQLFHLFSPSRVLLTGNAGRAGAQPYRVTRADTRTRPARRPADTPMRRHADAPIRRYADTTPLNCPTEHGTFACFEAAQKYLVRLHRERLPKSDGRGVIPPDGCESP